MSSRRQTVSRSLSEDTRIIGQTGRRDVTEQVRATSATCLRVKYMRLFLSLLAVYHLCTHHASRERGDEPLQVIEEQGRSAPARYEFRFPKV